MPDDFIRDLDTQAWYAPGEPSLWDAEAWRREFDESVGQNSRAA